jgi:hypothetical protein
MIMRETAQGEQMVAGAPHILHSSRQAGFLE